MKIPIGKGTYKRVGTTRLFGKTYPLVRWTGKKRTMEYWECEKCYREAANEDWLEDEIESLYGKRCKDYEGGCACCQAWAVHDTIVAERKGEL